MKTSDFYFDLPQELIAQKPSGKRGEDKLMLLGRNSGDVQHKLMSDLPDLIDDGTLMVFNNSRVRRSRCYGIKTTSGREQEFMFLNQIGVEGDTWNTMVKGAKKVKAGNVYKFPDGSEGVIVESPENEGTEFRSIKFPFRVMEDWFANHNLIFGDSTLMRWYVNNTGVEPRKNGNKVFIKVEEQSRKNDGFMAFAHAASIQSELKESQIIDDNYLKEFLKAY